MKRRLLIVAVFLLAGAVVNVAVAWGCALCVDVHDVGTYVGTGRNPAWVTTEDSWTLDIWSCPGGMLIHSQRAGIFRPSPEQPFPGHLLPYWSNLAIPGDKYASGASNFEKHFVEVHGWPLLALRCELSLTAPGVISVAVSAIETPWNWKSDSRPRSLPFRPIWPGFAVNSLVYAVVLWLMICGLVALRRFVRVRRGLCPACAYPRGESDVCSECGKALPECVKVTT